jgi:hypothetical protein
MLQVEEIPVPVAIVRRQHRIEVDGLYPDPVFPQEQVIVFDIVSNEIDLTRAEPLEALHDIGLAHILEVVLNERHKVGFSRLDGERNAEECPLPGIHVVRFRVYGA